MLVLGNAMENDTVDYRLTQIEKKLDTFEKKIDNLICLQVKTTEQEGRLKRCEIDIANIQRKQEKNLDRWISPFLSAIISGVVAFIFLKVGLK